MRDGLFLSLFPVQSLPVFHGRRSRPRDRRSTALGTAARPAGPGAGGSGPRCVERGIVPGGVGASRLAAAGGGGAPVPALQRAGRDRDLLVLVAAQRAVRPAFGEAADGACGGGGDVRRVRRRRERRARGGPSPAGRASPAAGSRRRVSASPARWPWEGRARRRTPASRTSRTAPGYGRSSSGSRCCETWRSSIALAAMLGGARRLHSQGRGGRLFRTGPTAGALLRTVLLRHRPGRVC